MGLSARNVAKRGTVAGTRREKPGQIACPFPAFGNLPTPNKAARRELVPISRARGDSGFLNENHIKPTLFLHALMEFLILDRLTFLKVWSACVADDVCNLKLDIIHGVSEL